MTERGRKRERKRGRIVKVLSHVRMANDERKLNKLRRELLQASASVGRTVHRIRCPECEERIVKKAFAQHMDEHGKKIAKWQRAGQAAPRGSFVYVVERGQIGETRVVGLFASYASAKKEALSQHIYFGGKWKLHRQTRDRHRFTYVCWRTVHGAYVSLHVEKVK